MKVLIFENEYEAVKGAFEYANFINFDDSLKFEVYVTSQSFNFSNINDYQVIFIDIDLSTKSELDGFGIIRKILNEKPEVINKVVILTGNNKISEILKDQIGREINLKIITKPTDFDELTKVIQSIFKINKVIIKH